MSSHAVFTPTDSTDFAKVSGTAAVNVSKGTPTITWANPTNIVEGTALGASQLDATASVPGTFSYSPAAGAGLGAGNQTLTANFTPTDLADYARTSQISVPSFRTSKATQVTIAAMLGANGAAISQIVSKL